MAVGLFIDPVFYKIGSGSFLNSFFSTIYVKLENNNWGSKYPLIMNDLYNGCVNKNNIDEFKEEISRLRLELKQLHPDQIVWNFEDLSEIPPWGSEVSSEITSMENYFVTSEGYNLIDVIEKSIVASEEIEEDICIKSI